MKKKISRGNIAIFCGMLCSLLFMAPLYTMLFFNPQLNQEWLTLSIAPGMLGCGLIVCGNYIVNLEEKIKSLQPHKSGFNLTKTKK